MEGGIVSNLDYICQAGELPSSAAKALAAAGRVVHRNHGCA
jgi:hypothetical protein